MDVLEKLSAAEFLGSTKGDGRTSGQEQECNSLPPGCNCVCNQPCNFARDYTSSGAAEETYVL